MSFETAHILAHFIEWQHAKDRAKLSRILGVTPEMEFDALAATCLGELIYTVAKTGKFSTSIHR